MALISLAIGTNYCQVLLDFFQVFVIRYFAKIHCLTPKGPLSLRGTNLFLGRYLRAEILSWLFETFLEDRKSDKLHGNIIFFTIGAREQKLWQISWKQGTGGSLGSKKKIWKILNFFFLKFFTCRLCFCLSGKLWFIWFGFVMKKLWTFLFFGQLEHLFEKNNF